MNKTTVNTKGTIAESKRFVEYQTIYNEALPEPPPEPTLGADGQPIPQTNNAAATQATRQAKYGQQGMSRNAVAKSLANNSTPKQ